MITMRTSILIISCLFSIFSYSQKTYRIEGNKMEKGITSTIPSRDVLYMDDGIDVVYSFKGINIYPDPIYKSASIVKIDGFGLNNNEGEPCVPLRWDSFVVPKGSNVTVSLKDSTSINLPLELSPSRKALSDSDYQGYDSTIVVAIRPFSDFYPRQMLCEVRSSDYGEYEICKVCISPIKYNYSNKSILLANQLRYHISWNGYNKNTCLIKGKACIDSNVFLSNFCLNYQLDEMDNRSIVPLVSNYLIVTHPDFYEAAIKFSKWKRMLGYNVSITCKTGWTSNEIKDSITHYYNDLGPMDYLLIIGDHEYVPAKYYNGYYSDYWYGCVSGSENGIPEIRRGRLPATTMEEAFTMVDKIIGYEYNPPTNESFYETGVNCAYFQDEASYGDNENGGYDGIETRRFVKTSEEIRDYMIGQGKDVLRVYDANALSNPMRYNNDIFSFGDSIPAELRRPCFSWNGNYLDIINHINSGAFYVLHRDHGGIDCWADPRIYNSHVSSLTNGNKLPVVFSINCLTGKYNHSTDCFAEAFMKNPNGGCVAIFAPTDETPSGYNDALTEGMFNSIWPNPGLIPVFPNTQNNYTYQSTPIYKLGCILDNGFMKMEETYNSFINIKRWFHCFGDPSMQIYTEKPTPFSSASVNRITTGINVLTGEGNAYITFYDCSNGMMQSYFSASMTFSNPLFNLENTVVCISSHNKIPFIDNMNTLYLQNETIVNNKTISSPRVVIGRDVTPLKAYGPVVIQNGNLNINANTVEFKNDTSVEIGSILTINTGNYE